MQTAHDSAAKMRQGHLELLRQDLYRALLIKRLQALRPWQDSAAVDPALRQWSSAAWGVVVRDAADVAHQLRLLGQYDLAYKKKHGRPDVGLSAQAVFGIATLMLRNVVQGRGAMDYDGMAELKGVVTTRTRSRYRGQFGGHATVEWLRNHVEYPTALRQLMLHGKSKTTARRWIERNPGVWPACSTPHESFPAAWRLMSGRCRTYDEYLQRHFSGDWPTPSTQA